MQLFFSQNFLSIAANMENIFKVRTSPTFL